MTDLNRRTILAGAATSALAAAISPQTVQAFAPQVGKAAPSFYRVKHGDFELTQIADGANTFPMPDKFVTNATKDEGLAAAAAAHMPTGKITVPFNPMVVNTGSKLVLIDTGNGPGGAPNSGMLQANLAAAGIDPKTIDIVVLSHMHPDHINGLSNADGTPAFPNAEIKVPAVEWAFWTSADNAAKAVSPMMKNYFAGINKTMAPFAKTITQYDWGKDVAPGILAIDTSGHTPGHTSFVVASGSAKMLVQSDVTNIPEFFLRNPEWQVMFDVDPAKAIITRRKFYDMAVADNMLISGYHFAFPSMGYVEKDGTGYRLLPVRWSPVL